MQRGFPWPGTYKIYIGLAEADVQKEVTITVTEGKTNMLEFLPLYYAGRFNRENGSFYYGVGDFEVFLDGKRMSTQREQ